MQYVATSMTSGGTVWRRPDKVSHHPGGYTGVILGYLAKADCLHRLALRGDQLLLDG
jgi:hypothetical protein